MNIRPNFADAVERRFGKKAVRGDHAGATALYEVARILDGKLAEQAEDASSMADRFTRYSAELVLGRTGGSPFNYSSMRDMEKRTGEIDALRETFRTLVMLFVEGETARQTILAG